MKKTVRIISALSAAMLLAGSSLAEAVSFDGSVVASQSVQVFAELGGTVDSVPVKAGDVVTADSAVAVLRTVKVYATEDGVIGAIFGQAGDDAATVAERYGAVLYLGGEVKYTISGSTSNAYSSVNTTYVTPGQTVYLRARSASLRSGTGLVTVVDGNSYTVEVLTGSFIAGESVNIFAQETCKEETLLGRGSASRRASTAVTAEGTIVNIPVKTGQQVKRGDLLLETLTGSTPGLTAVGSTITAGVNGVVASVSASEGSAVSQDELVAVIYPEGSMVIEGSIYESDMSNVHIGDAAVVTLLWNEDSGVTYPGTISAISSVAGSTESTEDNTDATYLVTVSFTPDANTRYGMSATVVVGGETEE